MAGEMKHTSGPWYEGKAPRTRNLCILSNDAWICGQIDNNDTDEGKANARLIAAAPDLLAALQDAMEAIEYYHEREGAPEMLKNARAAIKRATGGRK